LSGEAAPGLPSTFAGGRSGGEGADGIDGVAYDVAGNLPGAGDVIGEGRAGQKHGSGSSE